MSVVPDIFAIAAEPDAVPHVYWLFCGTPCLSVEWGLRFSSQGRIAQPRATRSAFTALLTHYEPRRLGTSTGLTTPVCGQT